VRFAFELSLISSNTIQFIVFIFLSLEEVSTSDLITHQIINFQLKNLTAVSTGGKGRNEKCPMFIKISMASSHYVQTTMAKKESASAMSQQRPITYVKYSIKTIINQTKFIFKIYRAFFSKPKVVASPDSNASKTPESVEKKSESPLIFPPNVIKGCC